MPEYWPNSTRWRTIACPSCSGYGMRMDGDGPAYDCPQCEGGGDLYILPSGHTAIYPGRMCGSREKEAYESATPVERILIIEEGADAGS